MLKFQFGDWVQVKTVNGMEIGVVINYERLNGTDEQAYMIAIPPIFGSSNDKVVSSMARTLIAKESDITIPSLNGIEHE